MNKIPNQKKDNMRTGDPLMDWNCSDQSTVEISENTEKSPRGFMRLAVFTENHHLVSKVKLSPFSRGRPEGSLFNSYYTEM